MTRSPDETLWYGRGAQDEQDGTSAPSFNVFPSWEAWRSYWKGRGFIRRLEYHLRDRAMDALETRGTL